MTKDLGEYFDFIDDFLRHQENFLHGQEGDDCTKARAKLAEIQKEFKKLKQ